MRSKAQISLNSDYHVNSKDFLYQTLCVFSQIKDRKHIEYNFYFVAGVMPQGTGGTWGAGGGGVKTFFVGICD